MPNCMRVAEHTRHRRFVSDTTPTVPHNVAALQTADVCADELHVRDDVVCAALRSALPSAHEVLEVPMRGFGPSGMSRDITMEWSNRGAGDGNRTRVLSLGNRFWQISDLRRFEKAQLSGVI